MLTKKQLRRAKRLQSLVEAVQDGDNKALEQLCLEFTPLIKKQAKGFIRGTSLGEDAIGIAWEAFICFVKNYDGSDFIHLPGLFRAVITGVLLNKSRCRGYYDPHLNQEQDIEEFYFLTATDNALERAHSQLEHNLRQLSSKQRQILELVDIDGHPEQQACAILDMPDSTLRYHLYNARKSIAELYTEQGI